MFMLAGIFGTGLLEWQWLTIPPALTLAAGVFLSLRGFPGPYAAAQLIDCRLRLADALSTALFFLSPGARWYDEEMRGAQIALTCSIAARVQPRDAVPFRMPKAAYASAILAIAAAGLLVLRCRLVGRLDLRPPISPIVQQLLLDARDEIAAVRKLFEPPSPKDDPAAAKSQPQLVSQAHETVRNTSLKSASATQPPTPPQKGDKNDEMATDDPESGGDPSGSERDRQASDHSNDSSPSGPRRGSQQQARNGDRSDPEDQNSNESGSNPGMINRLSDTVSNLLSALKGQPGNRGRQPMDMNRGSQAQTGKSNGKPPREDKEGSTSGSSTSDRADGAEQREGAQSASAGQSLDGQNGKQPGTGAGKDEGNKNLRLAEQRDAMGKISVILGKRSENLTGTTAVEVVSGEQSLQTQYEGRKSAHGDVRARAVRDEVPLEYQSYVRQYFRAVRDPGARGGK